MGGGGGGGYMFTHGAFIPLTRPGGGGMESVRGS